MKKRTLIVAAMLAAMTVGANAQENLALNKTTYASSNETNTSLSVDGNTGTRWEQNGESANNVASDDSFWYSVDLTGNVGETADFNLIQIVWENNNVKKFDILVSDDGESWNVAYTTPDGADNSGTKNYDIGDQKARFVKLKATELNGNPWFSFWEFRVMKAEQSVLTTVKPNIAFVKVGEPADISFACTDQYGGVMNDFAISNVDGATFADGKLTATQNGRINITVVSGDRSVTTYVYALGADDSPVLTLDTEHYDYHGIYGSAELGCDNSQVGWESGYKDADVMGEMTIGTTPAMQLSNLKKILVGNSNNGELGLTNTEGYTDATIAVYSDRDATVNFRVEATVNEQNVPMRLEAGKWNYLTVAGFTTETVFKYFDLEGAAATDGSRPNVLVSNIYLSKIKSGEPTDPDKLVIDRDVTSDNGYLKVTGKVTADNKSELESADLADVTAFDLSNVTFEEGVGALTFANPNAMIQVAGTVENNVGILSDNAKNIEGTPNMVVRNTWYFPVSKVTITDGHPVWTNWFISTGNQGYEYTRNVKAGKWITITSPANIYELPEGLLVYEAVESTEANTIAFNKVTTIAAHTPYIAYAKNDLTLAAEGNGDLDMETSKQQSKSLGGGLTLNSTYAGVNGSDGNYYGIYSGATGRDENNLTLQRLGATAKLGAFRAYISVPTSQNISEYKVLISDGTETAIYNIQTTDEMKSANGIYSTDGRLIRKNVASTEGLAKGIYIINGKKVVIK